MVLFSYTYGYNLLAIVVGYQLFVIRTSHKATNKRIIYHIFN